MSAMDRARPRPRAQVASSASTAARKRFRTCAGRRFQATIRSHAGSPTPAVAKSMTALSRPRATSRLPGIRSEWTHTAGPDHSGASRAASHAAVAALVSMTPFSSLMAARVSASCVVNGPPRWAAGPSVSSIRRTAAMNAARSVASPAGSARPPTAGFSPSSQRWTDQGQGKSSVGSPSSSTTGMSTGSSGASRGSHRCSNSTSPTIRSARGSRTAIPSPSRNIAFDVPSDGNRSTGRSAHRGNRAATSRRTSGTSMSNSSACILPAPISGFSSFSTPRARADGSATRPRPGTGAPRGAASPPRRARPGAPGRGPRAPAGSHR